MAEFEMKLSNDYILTLALFTNVQNTSDVRKSVMNGTLECTIMKPSFIIHPLQVVAAANKAVHNQLDYKLTTKSVFTEILYNLSLSKNITQSLLKFGIGDSEKELLVATICNTNEEKMKAVAAHIEGEQCAISHLDDYADKKLVQKVYKIQDSELCVSSLLDSVVSRIATKDFVAY